MKFKSTFCRQLFCRHKNYPLQFMGNLHGDDIKKWHARSVWVCPKCGKVILKKYFFKPEEENAE